MIPIGLNKKRLAKSRNEGAKEYDRMSALMVGEKWGAITIYPSSKFLAYFDKKDTSKLAIDLSDDLREVHIRTKKVEDKDRRFYSIRTAAQRSKYIHIPIRSPLRLVVKPGTEVLSPCHCRFDGMKDCWIYTINPGIEVINDAADNVRNIK